MDRRRGALPASWKEAGNRAISWSRTAGEKERWSESEGWRGEGGGGGKETGPGLRLGLVGGGLGLELKFLSFVNQESGRTLEMEKLELEFIFPSRCRFCFTCFLPHFISPQKSKGERRWEK